MSSSYYALCTSHTPAIAISADLGRTDANNLTTRDRLTGHDHCDIVIERVSGGIVELACPGTQLLGPTGCKGNHLGTEWIDVAWLRLLTAATAPGTLIDPALLHRVSTYGCWTAARIDSLRQELGMPSVDDPAADAHAVVQAVTREQLHDAIRTLARMDRPWWDGELRRMARLEGRTSVLGGGR